MSERNLADGTCRSYLSKSEMCEIYVFVIIYDTCCDRNDEVGDLIVHIQHHELQGLHRKSAGSWNCQKQEASSKVLPRKMKKIINVCQAWNMLVSETGVLRSWKDDLRKLRLKVMSRSVATTEVWRCLVFRCWRVVQDLMLIIFIN